jgi:transcriptional regulator with XRE-family HTH domain
MLSDRIEELRKLKNWNGKELASAMGVTGGAVTQFNKRTVKTIKSDGLECLARIGVNINWLLTGEGSATINQSEHQSPIIHRVIVIMEELDEDGSKEVVHCAEKELKRVKLEKLLEDQKLVQQQFIDIAVQAIADKEHAEKEEPGELTAEEPKGQQAAEESIMSHKPSTTSAKKRMTRSL